MNIQCRFDNVLSFIHETISAFVQSLVVFRCQYIYILFRVSLINLQKSKISWTPQKIIKRVVHSLIYMPKRTAVKPFLKKEVLALKVS